MWKKKKQTQTEHSSLDAKCDVLGKKIILHVMEYYQILLREGFLFFERGEERSRRIIFLFFFYYENKHFIAWNATGNIVYCTVNVSFVVSICKNI